MSALDTMVRVHRWILDEKRQKLADIERFVDRMRLDLTKLDENLAKERAIADQSPDARLAYSSFVAAAVERRRRLLGSIENLEREANHARDEVNEAFHELKKYETARENADERERKQQKKRDQLALDETGVSLYRRRNGADGTTG
jgi:flagellar export protein FliJ